MTSIGQIGEQFVGQWLITQGWQILKQRWRSPWGEIDLIAQHYNPCVVAFVEVKTRQSRNWDSGGVLSITAQKQAKIRQTADYFLGEYPQFADFPCRFDVALVHYKPCPKKSLNQENITINIGESLEWQGYKLTLLDYIEAAF
ncbi:YraN family protein [Crocosphaera sp. UHCC 0190]|uniref:YraN family protein n=1 Tax=Crocosphaera sp. UHCC 0190 TaxID=3110246 RepID=UPI002B1FC441|nr:YraN family protein [Crocosphaera sp. UHCC 0190]MEA5509915.1 YraN family protein [Crocosphaera sp. UHCC 0190]